MKEKISKVLDSLADGALFIAILFLILFGAYLLGLEPLTIFILLHVIAIIIFAFSRKKRLTKMSLKQAENFHNGFTVAAVLIVLLMLSTYDKTEAYLDNKLINGQITSHEVDTVDSDGNDTTDIVYEFIPASKRDREKKDLILYWVVLISFGVPAYMYWGTDYIQKKVQKITKLKRDEDANNY